MLNTIAGEGWDVNPYTYCTDTIPKKFSEVFGSPSDNDLTGLANIFADIANLPGAFGAGQLNLRLIRTNYVLPSFNNSSNHMPALFEKINTLPNVSYYEVTTPTVIPFSIEPKSLPGLTYQVDKFIAINLNAFVDDQGKLAVDSDGDGVPDEEEIKLKWDPTNPRSQGKCSDGIFQTYGCVSVQPCDPNLDEDSDGLNQCEEITVRTNEQAADTDGDGIPDLYELKGLGLNPNLNESTKFSFSDGFTDHQHFMMGVSTKIPISNSRAIDRVQIIFENTGSQTIESNGFQITKMNYFVNILNIPLVPTLAVNSIPSPPNSIDLTVKDSDVRSPNLLYRIDRSTGVAQKQWISALDQIGPQNHGAGINQIVFLVKMQALENKSVNYWLIQRLDIPVVVRGNFNLKLDFGQFHPLRNFK
jgi:hypothetical protein